MNFILPNLQFRSLELQGGDGLDDLFELNDDDDDAVFDEAELEQVRCSRFVVLLVLFRI